MPKTLQTTPLFLLLLLITTQTSTTQAQECQPIQTNKLLANDGAAYDWHGKALAIDNNTAIVGSEQDDDNGQNSGSAYIFTQTNGIWTQQAKLLPNDGTANDYFGSAVAIKGDLVIIGAWGDRVGVHNSGSAYIFTRSNNTWTQQAKLTANDASWNDQFGSAVAIDTNPNTNTSTAVVGTPLSDFDTNSTEDSGAAYVFTKTGQTWTQQAKLIASDREPQDNFANTVSISGNTIAIGSHLNNHNGNNSGADYIFTQTNGIWTPQTKLTPTDPEEHLRFGYSISLDNNTAIISAHRDNDNGNNSGSAYIFTQSNNTWTQQAKLLPADGAIGDEFGSSVSISGNSAIIGAAWDDEPLISEGAAYLFNHTQGAWTQHAKILPESGGSPADHFGIAVSISANTVLIGAHLDDTIDWNSGATYTYQLQQNSPADLNNDGLINFTDVSTFVALFTANNPTADFNNDGLLNFTDVSAFVAAFTAGCP